MKVSALIPFILSSTVFAATTRRSNSVLTSRQAHLKRGLVDVCVALDLDIELLDILPGGVPLIEGHIDLCLCLSVLPDFVKTNDVAQKVVQRLGSESSAHDYFAELINKQPNKEQCHYPDHCESVCDVKNPCGWQCKDGYVPDDDNKPSKCICPAPLSECNGHCGYFPRGCSSQAVSSKKKRTATCSAGKTLCGVPGRSNGKGHECVDTQNSRESCGGCVVDAPFSSSAVKGKDCRAIPNVALVECVTGGCLVSSCAKGYTVSSTRDSCVSSVLRTQSKREQVDDLIQFLFARNIVAKVDDILSLRADIIAALSVGRLDAAGQADQILNVLVKQSLVAEVLDLVVVRELLSAHLQVAGLVLW